MKILVGELSAITRSIEKELFGFNSFFSKIEFARSWEEILQQVKENRPDGIILDESLVNEKTLDSAIAKIKTLGIKTILTTFIRLKRCRLNHLHLFYCSFSSNFSLNIFTPI